MEQREFETLMNACGELARRYPEGLVYIGGIAVYLHAINSPAAAKYAEFTHDADLYLSLADLGDLRDAETLTPNRRLSKHQLLLDGFEFDVYTERQSGLIVPYDAVIAHSTALAGIRCACLEHLLALKVEAYRDRKASTKGAKDAKDLLRIGMVGAEARSFDGALAAPYLTEEHLALLEDVERSPAAVSMAQGNAVVAKRLRSAFATIRKSIVGAFADPAPSRTRMR